MSWKEEPSELLLRVRRMTAILEHRGPDDTGTSGPGRAVLGATRLSVRGGAMGRQPIVDSATGIQLVCNGEIDNHRELRSWLEERGRVPAHGSDVSVLPSLYLELGEAFLEKVDGAYALALWDPRNETLLLARDRVGERPLFFSECGDEVIFATELSALAQDERLDCDADRRALSHYLRYGVVPTPWSPLSGVEKVSPAERVVFARGRADRRHYWNWPLGAVGKKEPDLDEFDRIFRSAVERQADSDTNVGLFLSGGVDSSLVSAVLRDADRSLRIPAYTLRFREASYDEGSPAAEVVDHLGLDGHVVWVEASHFPSKVRELVRLVGEPLADPAWIPTALLAARAAEDVKVVLVGEGGDEVFGGYPTYLGASVAARYAKLPSAVRSVVAALVRTWPASDRKVSLSYLLKRFVDGDGMEPFERHLLWTSMLGPNLLERLGGSVPPSPYRDPGGEELLDRLQHHDLETSLAEGLLTKADRASMGWALEPRAPFLDRRVMEFAATLPVTERVRGLRTKVFLKRYALRYLPSSIVHRRKRGLSVPLSAWLRGPLQGWAGERLRAGFLDSVGIDGAAAVGLLEEHLQRRCDRARALWTLLVLAEWIEWREEVEEGRIIVESELSAGVGQRASGGVETVATAERRHRSC